MGLVASLIVAAAGLILALAVHPTNPGSVNVNTIGWILFIVGLFGFIIDLVLWSDWGPGYMRRAYMPTSETYVRRRRRYPPTRRTIVEEEDVPGPPPAY
jgi:hypothetical protein